MRKIFTLLLTLCIGVTFAQTITVELLTDNYSNTENAWSITDRDGNVVATNPALGQEVLTSVDVTVNATNCYTFTMTDSYNDGIAGYNGSPAGYLNISYNGTYVGGFTTANSNFGGTFSLNAIGGGCTTVDGALTSITTSEFQAHNGSENIGGTLTNSGEVTITSFDATYNVNGGTESSVSSHTSLNVAPGATYDFTHNVPYTFDTTGVNTVNVTISNINGGGETNMLDNLESKTIIVYTNSVARRLLIENFTTGVCPNCPPVHTLVENYVAANPNAIVIAQHAGYYTDAMTIPENTELLAMFNDGGSTYAPALTIDRKHFPTGLGGGAQDPGPAFFPNNAANTNQRLNDRKAIPAFYNVNINGVLNGTSLELDITGDIVSDVAAGDVRLVVYLTENGIVAGQSGQANPSYVHNDVMRDALSGTWGDANVVTSFTEGSTFSKHYSYTLNPAWVTSNMHVVAFLANYNTMDVNKREVLNSNEEALSQLAPLSVDNEILNTVNVYPNPAKDRFTIDNAEGFDVSIFSILGKEVMAKSAISSNETFETSNLTEGTYFVKIYSNDSSRTEKLVITK